MNARPGVHPVARRMLSLALLVGAIALLDLGVDSLGRALDLQVWPWHSELIDLLVAIALLAFVIAMAMPFVPGIEIGLALMLVLGNGGIALVYLATQCALALSFALGRALPRPVLVRACARLGLSRLERLLVETDAQCSANAVERACEQAPSWCRRLVRQRYMALVLALNMPGNAVIGGAGGIGMMAGMSRMFPFSRYLIANALATSPVPLFLLITGT